MAGLKHAIDFLLLLALTTSPTANAGDPDIISDFIPPAGNASAVDGSYFTYTGFRQVISPEGAPSTFTVVKATRMEFPALKDQSVSLATLLFPAGAVNPPHTQPRSAELLFLVMGTLQVGFVNSTNRLYTQTLQPGDLFVFPKGLVHYQFATGPEPAVAIFALGSSSAGMVSIPNSVFGSGIDDVVLAKSFKTDVATIQKVKAGLAVRA
ncbi:hypothetical protein Taro_014109 [Colocasia esculenta]|uniref:Germin-like protein n=1 Tax=Colocasia esculenta TaxID=4460 RepID=A0A843U895_COLES|nr:hypothetical protein [Colocasia esculenta]